MDGDEVATPAHSQDQHHDYIIAYPEHQPRQDDPNYVDFEAYRKRTVATAVCSFGAEVHDFTDCAGGLELHHTHIEFALQNSIDLKLLEAAYPGVSDPTKVGAWVESANNLIWLCQKHHLAAGAGIHDLDASDYEGSHFMRNVFSTMSPNTASAILEEPRQTTEINNG